MGGACHKPEFHLIRSVTHNHIQERNVTAKDFCKYELIDLFIPFVIDTWFTRLAASHSLLDYISRNCVYRVRGMYTSVLLLDN